MKKFILLSLTILISSAQGLAAPVRTLEEKPFNRIWSELSEDKKNLRILGKAVYGNDCSADKELFRTKKESSGQIEYKIYRSFLDEKNCIKIYQPVGRTYMIDEIPVESLSGVEGIIVNNVEI